ncbi:hypothetical protein BKA65DRAFT_273484 [Rhexocercosporidium sp. MPI-PUGE-AT-0058]|nr:hypothetical protein BKA65DRAFT_273484 [Rhexocercosporidium sp. MPI-PUGE-AT-0058]
MFEIILGPPRSSLHHYSFHCCCLAWYGSTSLAFALGYVCCLRVCGGYYLARVAITLLLSALASV